MSSVTVMEHDEVQSGMYNVQDSLSITTGAETDRKRWVSMPLKLWWISCTFWGG